MKRNRGICSIRVVLFVILAGCFACKTGWCDELDRFSALEGTLDIAGGTAHIPVMKDAAEKIMAKNPKIRITIAGGGSGVGVQKVGEGLVHIGNTGRPLTAAEIEKYGLKSFAFAIDGVAVAVNPKNSVNALTSDQVKDIFAGKITNWKDVGGADAPIHLFTRDEASGTREVFWEKLLKKGPIISAANVVPSNGAMKVALSQDTLAIGYLGIGHVDSTVKAIKLDGADPSQENASSGAYKVTRKLYMNTKGEPSPLSKAFIDYILGSAGQEIVKKHGYIPSQ
ncbi:MAG: phosphate ABC transporter substrate-binding protein [Desulfomonile sp.]|nr:phosphate ABC transporter substrate-binding protein [Desulfomonile sp.]